MIGAPGQKVHVQLGITVKGRRCKLYGGYYSTEGGTESQYHLRRDALQLAAHELGGKRAMDSPRGVHIVTAAGKDFFSKLRPFQRSKLNEWEDTEEAAETLKQDIEFRMVEIYQQLLKWPQSPLAPLEGNR
jgi:hypothetical protein